MAPLTRDSISSSERNKETFRDATRDFLLRANELYTRSSQTKDGTDNLLTRYYQLRINSFLSPDDDDICYLLRTAESNVRCVKCGNQRNIRLIRRKRENRSTNRKHCRYLRSKFVEYCNRCGDKKIHRQFGRQAIYDKLRQSGSNTKGVKRKLAAKSESETKQPTQKGQLPVTKQMVKRAPKNKQPQQPVIGPKTNTAQFSSRLRAFSCLLKQ